MKKLLIALLCPALLILYACDAAPEETSATMTTIVAKATLNSYVSTTAPTTINTNASKNDPYSGVLKANLDEYFSNSYVMENSYYAFCDIDGNGTEELLEGWKTYSDIALFAVYTIQNGFAVRQEEFSVDPDSDCNPLLFRNGTIRNSGDNERGGLFFTYYRFEDGELKLQTILRDEWGSYFQLNKTYEEFQKSPITKEEFEQVQKKYEGDGQVVEIDWKPLAEYGR